jgi:hypothetical protein
MSYQSEREPDCIHSRDYGGSVDHPASACSTCKNGPELAAWHAYWDAKPYEFVSVAPRDGDVFLTGRFVERPDSGLEWAEGISTQWVDGYRVHRR